MSELKMISPLLDNMTVENEASAQDGNPYYKVRNITSGERFILKCLSIPESEDQVNALILSGAYSDADAVNAYYGRVVESIKEELNAGKKIAAAGSFFAAADYQVERKESGVGYNIYILYPQYVPLKDILSEKAMSNLHAVNLGMDICDAVSACREAGYLFGNVTPDNIYLMPSGKFLLGGLGLVPLQDLKYACLPEEYIGSYAAPELNDISASPNTTIDLYSLGMILFLIYNGNHGPFEDEETGEAMAEKLRLTGKPFPTPLYADYELASIILRACAFKPEERFQTPEEFKQTLMLYMQRNEVSDIPIVPPIIADPTPVSEEEEQMVSEEPVRMTEADDLDDDFKKSFSPDLTGAGTEKDIDPETKAEPSEIPEGIVMTDDEKASDTEQIHGEQPMTSETEMQPNESAEASEASEIVDAEQINLDELLASVEEVVGPVTEEKPKEKPTTLSMRYEEPTVKLQHSESVPAAPDKNAGTAQEESQPVPKKKAGPIIGRIIAVILLLAAIGAAVYFLLTWYFVDIRALNLESCTIEKAVIRMTTEDDYNKFILSCSDNYGSSCPVTFEDGQYVITGLQPQTGYIVTVSAADYHALTSASTYTLSFTTPEATEVTEFTAERGEEDGQVILSFAFKGPQPNEWILSYANEAGDDCSELRITDTTCTVSDLKPNDIYTFTLSTSEEYFPIGILSVDYEAIPIVEVKNLNVSEILDNRITVTWEPGDNLPEEWAVTCESDGIQPLSETTKQTVCSFDVDSFENAYTITVSARGMKEDATLILPANPIVVNNLKAFNGDDGLLYISWDTPLAVPDGGWSLTYNTTGSYHTAQYVNLDESEEVNAVALENLIPGTQYDVSLSLIADNAEQEIFGITTLNFTTDKSGALDDFNFNPDAPLTVENENIALYTLPENEDWDYTDLDDAKDSFTANEKIAVCMKVDSVTMSGEDIIFIYVIRDAEGNVVNYSFSEVMDWSDMWYSRRHTGEIPLPCEAGNASNPGSYTFEIYVNGKLLASAPFTISK